MSTPNQNDNAVRELADEEGELLKLEQEIEQIAQKVVEYRTTFPDRLKSTLDSVLASQRPDFQTKLTVPEVDGSVRVDEVAKAMHILSRILPIESTATKDIFISAVRFATSNEPQCPTWENKLKVSAQEQAAYMLGDHDDDMQLIMSDDEVKFEIRTALSRVFSLFETELLQSPPKLDMDKISESMQDLEWIWGMLLKMDMTEEFVMKWIDISETLIRTIEDEKLKHLTRGLKVKIAELTSKALDAVGYGNVIVPSPRRVQLLQSWLPFVRKLKPVSDMASEEHVEFQYKMDDDLCEGIEGAIVALVSGLPSSDQANVLEDWLRSGRLEYPDLSEAFEVWCFRTKSATRRLLKVSDVADQSQDT